MVRSVYFRTVGDARPYRVIDCFVFSMRVYQIASVHLIRQASPATFPVQGKVTIVRKIANFLENTGELWYNKGKYFTQSSKRSRLIC